MIGPSRRVALELLCKIELEARFSDEVLASPAVEQLALRDRHLTTELVMGTLRWQGLLDHVLSQASLRPWAQVDPELRIVLRLSLHQMWHMDRIPDHAIVNDAVALARRAAGPGAGAFVNAILRKLGRDRPWKKPDFAPTCPPWARVSLPKWLWDRWAGRFGEERASEYALSLNQPPRTAVRISGNAESPDSAATMDFEPSKLTPGAYVWKAGRKDPSALSIVPGRIQDEASQLIPHLLGSPEGLFVWDACAAPGGKSGILIENAGRTGCVISTDASWPRARRMARLLAGVHGARSGIAVVDATRTAPFRILFHAVLADAPCSGLGTLRRNPDIKWRLAPEQLPGFASIQQRLLASVSQAVRLGGLLLYSTCSTEPEENEEVVSAFLTRHPAFKPIRPVNPPGVEALLDEQGYLRTFPGIHLWDGFFAALLRRTCR